MHATHSVAASDNATDVPRRWHENQPTGSRRRHAQPRIVKRAETPRGIERWALLRNAATSKYWLVGRPSIQHGKTLAHPFAVRDQFLLNWHRGPVGDRDNVDVI